MLEYSIYTVCADDPEICNSTPDLYIGLSQISTWMTPMYLKLKCVCISFPLLLQKISTPLVA